MRRSQYSMTNSSHPASNLVPNGRHYSQPSAAGTGHDPVATSNGFYSGNNNGINHSMQQYHQDNRRGTPPPPPPTSNSSTPSVYNGFHYSFSTPANASAPINPHHVGLQHSWQHFQRITRFPKCFSLSVRQREP